MKLFQVSFTGHYPVGSAAVVVAEDLAQAYELAVAMLQSNGLWEAGDTAWSSKNSSKDFTVDSLCEISLLTAEAHMLADGNY